MVVEECGECGGEFRVTSSGAVLDVHKPLLCVPVLVAVALVGVAVVVTATAAAIVGLVRDLVTAPASGAAALVVPVLIVHLRVVVFVRHVSRPRTAGRATTAQKT